MMEHRRQDGRWREEAAEAAPWTVARLVRDMAGRGDAPAVMAMREGASETWSYAELADTALRLAAGLREAGLEAGDAAAIYAPNAPEWVAAALALGVAGAVAVPVDDLAGDARAGAVIADSGARWLFSTRAHVAGLRQLGSLEGVGAWVLDGSETGEGEMSWRRLLAAGPAAALAEPAAGQPACLFYTSGTTGPPKAFTLSHANIGTNVRALAAERLVGPGDRVLLPLPLHHAYPYVVGMLTALETGMALVLPQSATGPHIAQALRTAQVSVLVGVPRLYEALVAALEARLAARGALVEAAVRSVLVLCVWMQQRLGLAVGAWLLGPLRRQVAPRLRLLLCGGARLDPDLARTLEALGWLALAGYGLAETASVFAGNLPRGKRLESAGMPLADGEVRIASPDAAGIGEIELRGSSVTTGYRDNPEANRAAFTEDGWFRTGDLGRLDGDGFLYVTGRAKEVIVLGGGKKVSPEELEKAYAADPLVAEIAVLERGGQLVGLVRPEPERLRRIGTLDAGHAVRVALAGVAQGLPLYERLAGFALVTRPLPRTLLGKYRRFLLPDLYEQALSGTREAPATQLSAEDRELLAEPRVAAAWDLLQRRYAGRKPRLDDHLALDLGIDSLEWMSLALDLEARLGPVLGEDDMARVETVRDLLGAVSRVGATQPAAAPRSERLAADNGQWLTPAGPGLRLLGLVLLALDRVVMRLLFRLRVEGLDRLPPTGPFLIVANHASDLDPLALAAALPLGRLRRVYWAGDVVRLFGNRLMRKACRAVRLYPLDERSPAAALDTAVAVLARGDIQVWFPEGWRSPDGRLQRFRPGIGELVARSRVPTVPVYIAGSFQAMPRGRRLPRLVPIRVVVGAPLDPTVLDSRGDGESMERRVANALETEVRALAAGAGDLV